MSGPKSVHRQSLGRWGEATAAEYLAGKGYLIIERNARTPYGELDLVARQDQVIVFVEVKTRASAGFGYPEASVTIKKQAHLLAAAQHYLQSRPALTGDWRVDVVAIRRRVGRPPEIVHFENALH
jgi:putative endonuclease